MMMTVKVWVDITNSPHVLFFEPLMRALKEVEFLVTARPCQQTVELLERKAISHKVVGGFHARRKLGKACGLAFRSFLLWLEMVKKRSQFAFSVSHGSPYCSIASRLAGIYNLWTLNGDKALDVIKPSVKFADKVVIPRLVPKANYVKMGAKPDKIVQYPGFKEEVYLWNFKADPHYLEQVGVETSKPIVVVRPEASEAFYVRQTGFLVPLLKSLKSEYSIVLLARTERQKVFYKDVFGSDIFVPSHVLDGPNLIANSDLVVSAGGTMNREAVILGKKVVSTYREDMLTVDKWLVQNEFMLHNPNPTKRFIDGVVDGKIGTERYRPSNKTFRFFVDLMEKQLEGAFLN